MEGHFLRPLPLRVMLRKGSKKENKNTWEISGGDYYFYEESTKNYYKIEKVVKTEDNLLFIECNLSETHFHVESPTHTVFQKAIINIDR